MCLDCYSSDLSADLRSSATPMVSAVPVTDQLAIFPRAAWAGDSRPPLGELAPEEVRFLLVHHTAGRTDYTEDDAIAEMQLVYAFHTGPEKNWPDVCYNFFIDRFGRVFEGRSGSLAGPVLADATGGNQGFSQLVCLLGDFTAVMPTPEALSSLSLTLAWLAEREGLAIGPDSTTSFVSRGSNLWPAGAEVLTNTIAGHRDMSQTACPGDTFYPYVTSTLRTDVAGRVSAGAAPTATTGAPTTAPTTSAIVPQTNDGEAAGTITTPSVPSPQNQAVAADPPPPPVPVTPATKSNNRLLTLALGSTIGVGAAATLTGVAWVIKRRLELQPSHRSDGFPPPPPSSRRSAPPSRPAPDRHRSPGKNSSR